MVEEQWIHCSSVLPNSGMDGVATTMSWKSGSFTEYKNYEIIILNELLLNSRLFIVDIPLFLELLHQPIMAKEKRNRYQVKRPYGESPCCIACGVGTFASAELGIIFEEREEWKQLEGKLAIVSSKEDRGHVFPQGAMAMDILRSSKSAFSFHC